MLNNSCYLDVVRRLQSNQDYQESACELIESLKKNDIDIVNSSSKRNAKYNQSTPYKGDNFSYLINSYKHKNKNYNSNTKIFKSGKSDIVENSELTYQIPLKQLDRLVISHEKGNNFSNLSGANTMNNYVSNISHTMITNPNSYQTKCNFSFKQIDESKNYPQHRLNFNDITKDWRGFDQVTENATPSKDVLSSFGNQAKPAKNKKFNRF
jgi:hypothetical protein